MAQLPKLVEFSNEKVSIQRTSFSIDTLARDCCSTLDESVGTGASEFDVIVIGSGLYGAYLAAKLFRLARKRVPRILVLERGPFLISEHVQNLSRIGYGIFRDIKGLPYQGRVERAGADGIYDDLVYEHLFCVGGKSLAWGKWSPRLTTRDLAQWPISVAEALAKTYPIVESETGVAASTRFIYGNLYQALKKRATEVVSTVPGLHTPLEPPIAAQGEAPGSGLFSFDAFSSLPLLIDAIRDDSERNGHDDKRRNIHLVPLARVHGFDCEGDRIQALHLVYGPKRVPLTLNVSKRVRVVLAAEATQSTRLALRGLRRTNDPGKELIGRNLMCHFRSNFSVRIDRKALGSLSAPVQAAALHVPGELMDRRFHVQIFASADPSGSGEAMLYRLLPDLDNLQAILRAQDSERIGLRVLTVGEMKPQSRLPLYSKGTSWLDLSPYDFERDGPVSIPRAFCHWSLSEEDEKFWTAMDMAAIKLIQGLAGGYKVEFEYNGGWHSDPPEDLRIYQDSLSSTFHEAGTLWMGNSEEDSVTNVTGRFHHIQNAYCSDQALFPSVGSANPGLTGLALSRIVAEGILGELGFL